MLNRASAAPASETLPLVAERLSDRLAARLGGQIDAGALRPGDRLPTEQRLAEAHGVSRTVVREAVHQLRSRGLGRGSIFTSDGALAVTVVQEGLARFGA